MKKIFLLLILCFSMYILILINSCTSNYATTNEQYKINDTLLTYELKQDTIKKTHIRKEINPIIVDTVSKYKRDKIFKQLQETEIILKNQQKTIDSILSIKRK